MASSTCTLPKTLKAVSQEKAYVREAGIYLKSLPKNGELKIAALDYRIGFYAEAKTVFISGVEQLQLAAKLRETGSAYLAAESKALQRSFPGLSAEPHRYGLALERTFTGNRRDRLLLYKVL